MYKKFEDASEEGDSGNAWRISLLNGDADADVELSTPIGRDCFGWAKNMLDRTFPDGYVTGDVGQFGSREDFPVPEVPLTGVKWRDSWLLSHLAQGVLEAVVPACDFSSREAFEASADRLINDRIAAFDDHLDHLILKWQGVAPIDADAADEACACALQLVFVRNYVCASRDVGNRSASHVIWPYDVMRMLDGGLFPDAEWYPLEVYPAETCAVAAICAHLLDCETAAGAWLHEFLFNCAYTGEPNPGLAAALVLLIGIGGAGDGRDELWELGRGDAVDDYADLFEKEDETE